MSDFDHKPTRPDAGATSVRFGAAYLRPHAEKDHYELMRPIVTVTNEGGRTVTEAHPQPIGPLAVYRRKHRGDDVPTMYDPSGPPPELKTFDQATMSPIDLVLVWWPGMDKREGVSDDGEI